MKTTINILPAIEQMRAIAESGWAISLDIASMAGEPPVLVGMTANRDLPDGGTIRISVARDGASETVDSLASDLLRLCLAARGIRK